MCAVTFCFNQWDRSVERQSWYKPITPSNPTPAQPADTRPVYSPPPDAEGFIPTDRLEVREPNKPIEVVSSKDGWMLRGLGGILGGKKHKLTPGMVVHQYATDDLFPKINSEAQVAKVLIDQRNNNFKVDLTETYWIKGGRFPESREKFSMMLRKWQYHRMIERKSFTKNSPFVVVDWRLARSVSNGRKLPPPPDDYKP
jgi:hypothetical protein